MNRENRTAISIKQPGWQWHLIPNSSWRNACFFGQGEAMMPCGLVGPYRGRLDLGKPDAGKWIEDWCVSCLEMEVTGEWPPDPILNEDRTVIWPVIP